MWSHLRYGSGVRCSLIDRQPHAPLRHTFSHAFAFVGDTPTNFRSPPGLPTGLQVDVIRNRRIPIGEEATNGRSERQLKGRCLMDTALVVSWFVAAMVMFIASLEYRVTSK